MSSVKKLIIFTISLIVIITNLTFANVKYDTNAIVISGGERHTLVLTANNWVWACGANGDGKGGWGGVLGTGSGDSYLFDTTLVQVHDGEMNTDSGYLENINDIDAGWTHSLALDVNGFVWACDSEILLDRIRHLAIIR